MNKLKILLLAMTLLMVACDNNVATFHRSGTVDNVEVEEPLAAAVSQYQPQQDLSNQFIDALKANDTQTIYDNYLATELTAWLTLQQFQQFCDDYAKNIGTISSYLPGQWFFQRYTLDGRDFLANYKIVSHDNGKKLYLMIVFDGDNPDKIIGFHTREFNQVKS